MTKQKDEDISPMKSDSNDVKVTVENEDISSTESVAQQPVDENDYTSSIPSVSRSVMRYPLPPFNPDTFKKYAWYDIDGASLPLLEELDPASRCAYERLGRLPGAARYELGNFRIDQYRTISFELIPAFGEVGYSEVTEYPPGTAIPPDPEPKPDKNGRSSPSPLMRFLQLTDKDVPVPSMLEEFDDSSDEPEVVKALAGRDLVESLDSFGTTAEFFQDNLAIAATPAAAAVWTCFNGGNAVFANTYCESLGTSHCDSGAWTDLTRHSGSTKRWVSHSRVAACGDAVYVEHQYRYWNFNYAKWDWTAILYSQANNAWWQVIPSGWVKAWKHVSNKKRRRRVKAWIFYPAGGYLRAWTAFYN